MGDPGWCLNVAVGAGSASGAVGVVLRDWWGGGVWVLRCSLCIFCCLRVAGALWSEWWHGWGLRGFSLLHHESKFNLLFLSIEHLVSSFSLCNFISYYIGILCHFYFLTSAPSFLLVKCAIFL